MFWLILSAFICAEEVFLRVAIRDQKQASLQSPVLVVGKKEVPLFDNGTLAGDVAGDQVWVTTLFVEKRETISFQLRSGNRNYGDIEVSLPDEKIFSIQFERIDRQLKIDERVSKLPWLDSDALKVSSIDLDDGKEATSDRVRLRFELDDARLKTLKQPSIRFDSGKSFLLKDDGSDPLDTASDNVWFAWVEVLMQESIQYMVEEGDIGLGRVKTRMPATAKSKVTVFQLKTGLAGSLPESTEEGSREVEEGFTITTKPFIGADSIELDPSQIRLQVFVDFSKKKDLSNPRINYAKKFIALSDDDPLNPETERDGIYTGVVDVKKGEEAQFELWDGGEKLSAIKALLPDARQAQVRLRYGDTIETWEEEDEVHPSFVVEAIPKRNTQTLRKGSKEQSLSLRVDTDLFNPKLRLRANGQRIGVYSLEVQGPGLLGVDVSVPVSSGIHFTILEGTDVRGEGWIFLPNTIENIVYLTLDRKGLKRAEQFSFDGQKYAQEAPSIVEAKELFGATFVGETALNITFKDLANTAKKVVVKGTKEIELKANGKGDFVGSYSFNHQDYTRLSIWRDGSWYSTTLIAVPKAARADVTLISRPEENSNPEKVPPETQNVQNTDDQSDKISVQLILDDQVLQRLKKPQMFVGVDRTNPILLQDDGSGVDKKANDSIFVASFVVVRDEYMVLSVEDEGKAFGNVRVFLPSSREAKIRLRTLNEENGLKLLSEAQSLSEVEEPSKSEAVTTEEGSERLVHILWFAILLFTIGFAYLRSVVYRTWTMEVRPVLERLEKFLDENEK